MKWALVLALVLCCGSTRGQAEKGSDESLDKFKEQLEEEFLFSARNLKKIEDEPTCKKQCNGNEECYIDEGGAEQCRCFEKFAKKGDECEACSKECKNNEECYFDEGGAEQCRCVEKFAKKDDECLECDCGDKTKSSSCTFNKEGEKVCDCLSMYADKNGTCTACDCDETTSTGCTFTDDVKTCECIDKYSQKGKKCEACDCGTNGTCSFDDKGQQVCKCNKQNEVKNGKCEFCYCGEKGNCSFVGENKVCLCEGGYAEDKDNTGECKECDCGNNGKCSFENKNKTCSCNKGYKENGGQCIACDCKGNGTCSFNETGAITCDCDQGFAKMKDGLCYLCDCGEHGTCIFDGNDKKTCDCKAKFADKNGTCVDCECGEEVKSCQFNNDGVKTCNCISKYEDNDGTCSECDCGEIDKVAKSCKFNNGVKACTCVSLHAPKDGTCTECGCGNTTVAAGCEFKDDEAICKCQKGYSQKDETCEVCNCGKNGNCSFVNENKVCACKDLYEEDNGTCKNCDCGKSGKCSFEDHKKKCACDKGFDELDGKCQVCDCGDDGDCKFVNNKKNCTCNDGYVDKNGICTEPCESDADCSHNTTCASTKWGSFCNCKKIFTGHKCEKVVACVTGGNLQNCVKSGGACSYNFTQNKAVCECYEEKKFDINLNICRGKCKPEKEICKHGGKCQDELCKCPTGTSGDDCSTVDDCDKDLKEKCEKISAKCVYDNTTNNATCQCNNDDLIYKNNKCTAKWCELNLCAADSECDYGNGSAYCRCTEADKYYDYSASSCSTINKCPLVKCKENEYCTDDGKCDCDKNHVKDKDECKRKKLCDSKPCSLNATCQEREAIGTVKCECPSHTYFNAKSNTCEVMIKEEEKCKDGKDCGPFGFCVQNGDASTCSCKNELAVQNKTTGVCILNGKKACISKKVLSNNPQKCNCSGTLKDSTNGITCEYMTCGDEVAQEDCKKKGAFCVDTKDSNGQKTYECKCSAGQTLTTDKGCVDACSDKAMECSKNQQTCYLDEKGFATCKCPPGFTKITTGGKTTCQLNVKFSYLLKELPVIKKEFLNEDQSVNKVKLNQYVIKSMKAVSSQSYVFGSVQNFRISDDVILCDVWLKFNEDAEQDIKRWRSQVVQTNDSTVLPPSLKLSSAKLDLVTHEKLEFCSPIVYQTVCGRQGSKCNKNKNACYCSDGYEVVGPSIQVIEGNTVLRCEDIDECNENKHSCKVNSQCMNTMGGYYCKCNPGFHKKDQNESEECVELCSSNPCNDGDCTVKENRVECSCKAGFKGSYCTESDDKLKKAQSSTKIVGGVLGAILAVTFVAIIAYVVKLKKNSYSEDFSSSPRDNSEMAERPQRGISNRGYQ